MKFVNQKAEIIIKSQNKLKNIAEIARVCYKSNIESNSENNAKLINNLISNKHFAMLEHEDFIFDISHIFQEQFQKRIALIENYYGKKIYLLITQNTISGNIRAWRDFYKYCFLLDKQGIIQYLGEDLEPFPIPVRFKDNIFFSDIFENQIISLIKSDKPYYYYIDNSSDFCMIEKGDLLEKNDILAHYRVSAKIICDRGISHEIVRHRNFSFAQESTRYVNYQNKEMQFIDYSDFLNKQDNHDYFVFCHNSEDCAMNYNHLVVNGNAPQIARGILPHNLKTEIVVTGNICVWLHFFNLRLFERTGKAHPMIKQLAKQLFDDFEQKTPISRNLIVDWSNKMWEYEKE